MSDAKPMAETKLNSDDESCAQSERSTNDERAKSTALLFTHILQKFLNENRCEYVEDDDRQSQWFLNMTHHVFIAGGFCRDILLNRAVSEFDVLIDLRTLTQYQRSHLEMFHSKPEQQHASCRCVYWQLYRRKLNDDPANRSAHEALPEMQRMHSATYIPNSNFLIDVLCADERLRNKLSVCDVPVKGFHSVQIVGSVVFDGVDCDGQRIVFYDTFDENPQRDSVDCENPLLRAEADINAIEVIEAFHCESRRLSQIGSNIHRSPRSAPPRWERSIELYQFLPLLNDFTHPLDLRCLLPHCVQYLPHFEMNEANLPIYSREMRDRLRGLDLSINTCILPLSDIADSQRLAEVHFDLGIDIHHARKEGAARIITQCVAEVMNLPESDIIFDKLLCGIIPMYCGHITIKAHGTRQLIRQLREAARSSELRNKLDQRLFPLIPRYHAQPHMFDPFQARCRFITNQQLPMRRKHVPWAALIMDGLEECSGTRDCGARMLRCPGSCVNSSQPSQPSLLWSILRWVIRENFTIDSKLIIQMQRHAFAEWVTPEWFAQKENRDRFMRYLQCTLERECRDIGDVRQMLQTMKTLRFMTRFRQMLQQSPAVRRLLMKAIRESNVGDMERCAIELEVNPLTSEMLQHAKPTERKQMIGERLFPKIQAVEPRFAGKITGMLLEIDDNAELLVLLSDQHALKNKVDEALTVLKEHQQDLMLQVNPVTSEMLQNKQPAEKKRMIGECLYVKVQVVEQRLAAKITGMLLEMDNAELLVLLSDPSALINKVDEALAVLKNHGFPITSDQYM